MGHISDVKSLYKKLQNRLDKYPIGAPESEVLYDILKMLYTGEEAEIASKMPLRPVTAKQVSIWTGKDTKLIADILDKMADKGLIVDFLNRKIGKKMYMLAPTVVGFFEFSMMRVRNDIDQKELAQLFHKYLYEDFTFAKQAFQKKTQFGRTLVHETALKEGDYSEILSFEKATEIIKSSKSNTVSLCYCRHKASHLNEVCDNPIEICMTLNDGADYIASHNLGRKASTNEMLDLLEIAREKGLVQIADNVKFEPSFICNCCGCCCGVLVAINKANIKNAVMTSNYIAKTDEALCKGCGKCVKRCPINAIELIEVKDFFFFLENKNKYINIKYELEEENCSCE